MRYPEFRIHDFDVEALFDEFVVSAGGELVKTLIGNSPNFDNADYLFRNYRVVLELKALQEDYLAGGGFMDRFHKALANTAGIGRIEGPGAYQIPAGPKDPSGIYCFIRAAASPAIRLVG
jgi:hypothetical protein